MKLSDFTLSVFKNFSTINSSFLIKPGHVQRTISPDTTILVEATLDENFTHTFGIYDLSTFIGNISTMDDPDLIFTEKMVTLQDEKFRLQYYSCQPNLIFSPKEDKTIPKETEVDFELKKADLTKIMSLAQLNSLPNISVMASGGSLLLKAHDKSNSSSIEVTVDLGETDQSDFISTLKVKNLKIIPGNYKIGVVKGKYAVFDSLDHKLTYFAGLEKK